MKMNDASRIYAVVLALTTTFCGWVLSRITLGVQWCYKDLLEAHALPGLTELAIRYHTWPYFISVASVCALAATFVTPKAKPWVQHGAFILTASTLILMLINFVAYVMPFTTVSGPLAPIK